MKLRKTVQKPLWVDLDDDSLEVIYGGRAWQQVKEKAIQDLEASATNKLNS